MRYWLTAIAAAALTIAAGWFFLLNPSEVFVRVTPSRTLVAPLGGALLTTFLGGAAAVGLLWTGGAIARGWRTWGLRRDARREARGREAMARVRELVWTGETGTARAELQRVPEHPASEAARLALLAETHLQEGDPAAARDVLERALPTVATDPHHLEILARAADELGDRPAAIDALERAYRAVPGSPRLAARLRDLYAAAGRWGEAVGLQAELLLRLRAPARLAAERATLIGLRYEASLAEADDLRAARQLRGLARQAPDFLPARVSAGDRYARAGRAFAARRAWLRGLRRRPAVVLLDRIETLDAAAGRPRRTTRLLRGLARRTGGDSAVHLRLAHHLLGQGALEEAAAVLDGVGEPLSRQAAALRGALARARGDAHAAAEAFATALGPDLGLTASWRCAACAAVAEKWAARCAACRRWDTLRTRGEDSGFAERAPASEALIRPEN